MKARPFVKYDDDAYPYLYRAELEITNFHGGVPKNPNVVGDFIKAKMGITDTDRLEAEVKRIFADDPTRSEEAAGEAAEKKVTERHLNGFMRDATGPYYCGWQLERAVQEFASIARSVGKLPERWGLTRKGITSFTQEHIKVTPKDARFYLPEPDGLYTHFPKSYHGSSITVEEYVDLAVIEAHIKTDHLFSEREWAMIWLTGEEQGLGATRALGCGRFVVTSWERLR